MSLAASRDAATTFRPPGWAGVGTCALDATGSRAPDRLPFHVLLLATAGHGAVEVDFFAHNCRPGTLLWIRPGQALRVGRNGLTASAVTFAPHLAGDEEPASTGRWQLRGEDEDAVISEFAQLAVDCERHRQGPLAGELLRQQLRVLLLRIALLGGAEPAGPESRTYTRFRAMLEAGHPHSRRVEDYADELGCSVRTLTRACLSVTGRTAKQVVDDRVALEARRLLACTSLSVAEVGRHLGFAEPTNFGRFFHREVGMSPGQFRADAARGPRQAIPAQRRPPDGA
ncbi:transcriptional regulator [Paractinoplanes deccanensis]|uniref:Transcriptional regulator n=1 Tax=Paractinoplanes deccanensis TaxID=113561 RepID=A0ABQ3XUN5_9ACTN|nr:AraC family transcriptional regulator [Actinoplanes deccanensis]GID71470.1 transcriptional regulator [Actinoplanes deccanensis]